MSGDHQGSELVSSVLQAPRRAFQLTVLSVDYFGPRSNMLSPHPAYSVSDSGYYDTIVSGQ